MVPQFVRRRYSTMFNGQPPFAFEHTDDRQDPGTPPYCSKTPPPGLSYHENPFQGYAPHAIPPRPVALDHDQVVLHRITPQDVVPALSPSPKISPIKAAELASEQDPAAFDQIDFPALPELVDDLECESPITLATRSSDDEMPTDKGTRGFDFLRCPQCGSILKWLFVKQFKNGLHHVHGCAPACGCAEEVKPQHIRADGSVQVSRGAW